MKPCIFQHGGRARSIDEGVNLESILLDQDEEEQNANYTLEDRLKEGRGKLMNFCIAVREA